MKFILKPILYWALYHNLKTKLCAGVEKILQTMGSQRYIFGARAGS